MSSNGQIEEDSGVTTVCIKINATHENMALSKNIEKLATNYFLRKGTNNYSIFGITSSFIIPSQF